MLTESFHGSVGFALGFAPRPRVSYLLLDFDGTLSLIRQGWPEVMTPMFVKIIHQLGTTGTASVKDLRALLPGRPPS
jgi:hypothetical protein